MENDNGFSLSLQEGIALNRWVYRLLCEESGPSNPIPPEKGIRGSWNWEDMQKALATVSEDLAVRYCEIGAKFNFRSSATWDYLAQHHPELIVVCIKAGAFKEIGDEDADNRGD